MFIFRPIKASDLDAFEAFAFKASTGVTNLPKNRHLLEQKINHSLTTFDHKPSELSYKEYIFVLEDLESGQVLGTSAIKSKTGGIEPECFYRIDTMHRPSSRIKQAETLKILTPVVYKEGPSEICALYLLPDVRKEGLGKLLSLSRLLYIASNRQVFDETIIVEMRGVIDADNQCPFWDSLGRHFLNLPVNEALDLLKYDRQSIPDLLPNYPIYVTLLSDAAQEVIGKTHPNTVPALKMLLHEGFEFSGEIDIFDGGPKISSLTAKIRTIRDSKVAAVTELVKGELDSDEMIISNVKSNADYRACFGKIQIDDQKVKLHESVAEALKVRLGDSIRWISKK